MTRPTQTAFGEALARFTQDMLGRNLADSTIAAYRTDVGQFLAFVEDTTLSADTPAKISKDEISAYLTHLAERSLSGVTRARKLAAIKEFFSCLVRRGDLPSSPATAVAMPKKERKARVYLRVDEFRQLLAAAGGHPRDYCILQLFLQTGIRVSELVHLTLDDVDLPGKVLRIRSGKGDKDREVVLEKKAIAALKSYLAHRLQSGDPTLFLNYAGTGISDRGVKKLVEKYRQRAGISKKISCHSLRHTFATYKAEKGVSPFQLQQWLGHESLNTTQLYVHMAKQNSQKVMEATSL